MTKKTNNGWNLENTYAALPKKLYSRQEPSPVPSPELIILNRELGESLGLDTEYLEGKEGIGILAGNKVAEGGLPLAQAYGGHQFGHFTILGDGRAILLGEQITADGKRYDIQLKGSGRTPYSRGGDGKASLGPMLREYIISEALHRLGVATTRSLAVVTTGENIYRERILPGAILTRIASSHIRVGTFQYVSVYCTFEELKILADYTIERHFPHLAAEDNKFLLLLREVIKGQAQLIASWQLIGFVHGVMNTDNMLISGESIDFGPCAFMDTYDLNTVFSSIDRQGRYAYGKQPEIALWNLARLADALLPLIDQDKEVAIQMATVEISKYRSIYFDFWLRGMRGKLGIFNEDPEDKAIIEDLLSLMTSYKADYNNTFRALTNEEFAGMEIFNSSEFSDWKKVWDARLNRQGRSRKEIVQLMKDKNPSIIPRNHLVEEALEAGVNKKDYHKMEELLKALKNPYAYTGDQEKYANLPARPLSPYRTFCGT